MSRSLSWTLLCFLNDVWWRFKNSVKSSKNMFSRSAFTGDIKNICYTVSRWFATCLAMHCHQSRKKNCHLSQIFFSKRDWNFLKSNCHLSHDKMPYSRKKRTIAVGGNTCWPQKNSRCYLRSRQFTCTICLKDHRASTKVREAATLVADALAMFTASLVSAVLAMHKFCLLC